MVQEFITAYSTNSALLIISAVTFTIGYLEYIYSTRLFLREHKGPYQAWMHSFYFAHDFTGAVVFFRLALAHNFFWVFWATSIALVIWNCFEIFNLYMVVKYERAETWGDLNSGPILPINAVGRLAGQIVLMFGVVNLFRVFMNDEMMFKWFALTNILIAVAPGYLWERRASRTGSSVGLAIVILVGTVNTFLPPGFGMWATALHYFNQPWFYLTGVVASAFALRNVIVLLRLPPKLAISQRAPIW